MNVAVISDAVISNTLAKTIKSLGLTYSETRLTRDAVGLNISAYDVVVIEVNKYEASYIDCITGLALRDDFNLPLIVIGWTKQTQLGRNYKLADAVTEVIDWPSADTLSLILTKIL